MHGAAGSLQKNRKKFAEKSLLLRKKALVL
jgi:hypothetical protein